MYGSPLINGKKKSCCCARHPSTTQSLPQDWAAVCSPGQRLDPPPYPAHSLGHWFPPPSSPCCWVSALLQALGRVLLRTTRFCFTIWKSRCLSKPFLFPWDDTVSPPKCWIDQRGGLCRQSLPVVAGGGGCTLTPRRDGKLCLCLPFSKEGSGRQSGDTATCFKGRRDLQDGRQVRNHTPGGAPHPRPSAPGHWGH